MAIKNTIGYNLSSKENKNNFTAKIAALSMFMAGTALFSGCTGEGSKSNSKQSCYDDYDCPGLERCVNSYCESPEDKPNTQGVMYNGVSIKTGVSDINGRITFIDELNYNQTNEQVDVYVKDELNNPIPDAFVTFFDANGWEGFVSDHNNFVPYVHFREHNSQMNISMMSLTSGSFQFHHYDGYENDNSIDASQKSADWIKSSIANSYMECLTAEEAKIRAEEERHVWNFLEKIPLVGQIVTLATKGIEKYYDAVNKLVELGILEGGECAAFRKWYMIPPSKEGENIRGSLWYWECLDTVPEDCGGSDCITHSSKVCNNGDVYWKDSCGNLEELFDDCNSNETCQDGECVEGNNCVTHSSKVCNNGDVYWKDSCGNLEEMFDDCNNNETCQDGVCQTVETTCHVGKLWQVEAPISLYNWSNAQNYCNNLILGGKSDWRMPTISELRSVVEGCAGTQTGGSCNIQDNGCLKISCYSGCGGCTDSNGPANGFYWKPNLWKGPTGFGSNARYWSSSGIADSPGDAWTIYFRSANLIFGDKNISNAIRCISDTPCQ